MSRVLRRRILPCKEGALLFGEMCAGCLEVSGGGRFGEKVGYLATVVDFTWESTDFKHFSLTDSQWENAIPELKRSN